MGNRNGRVWEKKKITSSTSKGEKNITREEKCDRDRMQWPSRSVVLENGKDTPGCHIYEKNVNKRLANFC